MRIGFWILPDTASGTFLVCEGAHVGLARFLYFSDAVAWIARQQPQALAA